MSHERIEVSVKGQWFRVPALNVNGDSIIRRGRWLKVAYVNAEQWLETPIKDPERCIKALKEERSHDLHADIFTFCQKLPDIEPRFSYRLEWESIAAIPITTFKGWWEGLSQEGRKNVRRSQKRGVLVKVQKLDQQLLEALVKLNNDSPMRQQRAYTHYGKTLEQVTKDQKAFLDRSDYICAYCEDELIGVVKLVYRGDIASILTFLSKVSHSDKRPANALMAKVVEICGEKKLSYVTFGLFNYNNRRDTSLREFKIRNGFREVLVPRYYVPLTFKGVICMKLKLHQGFIALLPSDVITMLVTVRAKLHSFKISRCSSMTEQSNRNRQMGRLNPPAGSSF
jgi:hypothetical protein